MSTAMSIARGVASGVGSGVGAIGGGGKAPALRFQVQPVGSLSGAPLTVQPIVEALGPMGTINLGFTGNVTIILLGTGVLTGTTVVAAVAGVATFTDLVITGAGSSNLQVFATGYQPALSNAITTT